MKIVEITILRFNIQVEDKLEHTLVASVMCLHFSMQKGNILEHTDGKCHVHTSLVNL